MTFSTGLVGVKNVILMMKVSSVSWLEQLTEESSTPTRPVENAILMTKGLQERNTQRWMGRR